MTVNGAILTSVYALYERDVQNDVATDKISVTLGAGNVYNGFIYSENCDNIVNTANENACPYVIDSVSDWLLFAAGHAEPTLTASDESYTVECDLDFTGVTERVDVACFSGTINFKGHTVSGVNSENTEYKYGASMGLFVLLNNATIKNLNYENTYSGAPNATARPVLFAWRGDILLDNVTVTGSVTHAENNASAFVYFVWATAGKNLNCEAEVAPINLIFKNCVSKVNITNTGANETSGYAAAFLGQVVANGAGNSLEFINCVNEGTITGYHYASMLIANQCSADNLKNIDDNTIYNFKVENCANKGSIYAGKENGATLIIGPSTSANVLNTSYASGISNVESGITSTIAVAELKIDENDNYVIEEIDGAVNYEITFTFWSKGVDKRGEDRHGTTTTTIYVNPDDEVKALQFINKTEADEQGIHYSPNEFGVNVTADGENYVFIYDETEYEYLNIEKQPTVYLTAYNAAGEVVSVYTHYATN